MDLISNKHLQKDKKTETCNTDKTAHSGDFNSYVINTFRMQK